MGFQYAPPHATQTDQTNHAPRGGACGDEFQYAPPRATQTDQTPQPWGHLDNKIFYPYPRNVQCRIEKEYQKLIRTHTDACYLLWHGSKIKLNVLSGKHWHV